MPDFQQLVCERLGTLGISPALEDEVIAELADHLEDVRATALRSGKSEVEAMHLALEQVPNWLALTREISAAKKEGPMNERMRSLWLPGMTMLIGSAVFMLMLLRLVPPVAWVQPNAPVVLGGSWLLMYLAFGAVGAYWSRQAGGAVRTRLVAGMFPVALHLAIFFCVVIAANLQNFSRTPEYLHLNFQLRVLLTFVVIPGIALAAGALPFLRNHANESSPSRA